MTAEEDLHRLFLVPALRRGRIELVYGNGTFKMLSIISSAGRNGISYSALEAFAYLAL